MDLFIEQIKFEVKDEGGYTIEGWKEIEWKMMKKFGDDYNKYKIRNYFLCFISFVYFRYILNMKSKEERLVLTTKSSSL